MDTGELPEAFEGEERTVAGVGDVLQLVSGRQLLGVVRERHDAKLQGDLASGSDMTKAELLCTLFWQCFYCKLPELHVTAYLPGQRHPSLGASHPAAVLPHAYHTSVTSWTL